MNEVFASPVFGIASTLVVYAASLSLHKRTKWAHPLITTTIALLLLLKFTHVSLQQYQVGGDIITLMLGPATVALGVPIYKHACRLKESLPALTIGIVSGAFVGMITAGVTAALFGASEQMVMSAVPKSVTTPIAMEVARQLHGIPEISAAMAVVAGALGSLFGPGLLRRIRISHDLAVGAAMGTASHALGTARCVRDSEVQASSASLAMALAGIATSVMAVGVPLVIRVSARLLEHLHA